MIAGGGAAGVKLLAVEGLELHNSGEHLGCEHGTSKALRHMPRYTSAIEGRNMHARPRRWRYSNLGALDKVKRAFKP